MAEAYEVSQKPDLWKKLEKAAQTWRGTKEDKDNLKALFRKFLPGKGVGGELLHFVFSLVLTRSKVSVGFLPWILKHMVDMKAADEWGRTALHSALTRQPPSPKIVKMLLECGVDVNRPDEDGVTALHKAVLGPPAIVKMLIDEGGDVQAVTKAGRGVLDWALAREVQSPEIVKMLLEGGTTENEALMNLWRRKVLHSVVTSRPSPEMVRMLLEAGVNVKAADEDGVTALHEAVLGPPAIVKMLLDAGADAKAVEKNGLTVLHSALTREVPSPEIVKMLLEAGAHVNAVDEDGVSVLHVAVNLATPKIAVMLVNRDADIHAVCKDGMTTLHLAVMRHLPSREIVRMLLWAGVDVKAADKDGVTALHRAVSGPPAIVKMLLDAGADAKAVAKDGRTPLHEAVSAKQISAQTVKMLVEAGADASARDRSYKTAAHIALERRRPDAAGYLKPLETPTYVVRTHTCSQMVVWMHDRLQLVRQGALCPASSDDEEEEAGLWGLPAAAWKEVTGILEELKGGEVDPQNTLRSSPPPSLPPPTVIPEGQAGPTFLSTPSLLAESPQSLTVSCIPSLLENGKRALASTSEVLSRIHAFRDSQMSITQMVQDTNSRRDSAPTGEPVCPFTPECIEQRDKQRRDIQSALHKALSSGASAVRGLRCLVG
uniref:Uncharacterized protein n=1 Tax=Chromera velia CCMP2878 TaxID=1169474 RepID=A0A0K6S7X7_9ALVE|eukprot:Cvel_23552.t2-p1 / transcript=Cvel_23552.t2 / gene=Cvel_23552 / organism=Chromera_velia_CCMP2878 / gene_product=Putative ankyrin repeat protein RF_0381, putative / transcript_product=Putative ankyrin repeat protein RF_0381, putative / location=Cvel_scaffold2440:7483-13300(+) / protein_length=657 / sequence_SO=supercontig / SO=protein_coding / is_pseudo=false